MATVGAQLTAPESGWKRYDDAEPFISYTGFTQRNHAVTGAYEGKSSYNANGSAVGEVIFSFVGTKVRIISSTTNTSRAESVSVSIDGNVETFTARTNANQAQTLVYEKQNLPYGTHTVKIFDFKGVLIGSSAAAFGLDAIDIDSNGHLVRTIGTPLTSPDEGWRRFDDADDSFIYLGENWIFQTQTGTPTLYNATHHYSARGMGGNEIRFKFYGTKMRLISSVGPTFADDISVVIDGVSEKFSARVATTTDERQRLTYEKTNLPLGVHEVKFMSGTNGDWRLDIDALDIDDNGQLIASIGTRLTAPEVGWKRYDDQDSYLVRDNISDWTIYSHSSAYKGSYLYATKPSGGTKICFDFIGTKIRVIDVMHQNRGISKIEVDGAEYTYSSTDSSSGNFQRLVFELLNLPHEKHSVTISYVSGTYISLDAIDIDSSGRLFHPDEVTNVAELEVGKRIRCHYIASRNSFGTFSRLGNETFDLISSSSNPIPMGDFYWIMVEDWNKRKFLVADRNIQNTISWDSINKEGHVFGVESTAVFKTHNKTPYLTSASDVYSVTGIGNSLTNEDPWRAFSLNGFWGSYAGSGLVLDCKRRVKFGEIKVTAYRGANMASVIDVYGSDNNVDYNLIKSCQKSSWSDSEQATFYFDQPVEYRYYKIMKTTQVSGSNAARLNLELSYSEEKDNHNIFKLRLLTGGINATDKDNEWDKYIVNSRLNGTIIAGDNKVWNYSGGASWTSTTNTSGSANRTGRGASGNVGASGYNPTSYVGAATATGFRPLMEVETLPMNRSLINHEGSYKRFNKGENSYSTQTAVPFMTSNTSPSGIASASSIYVGASIYEPWKAFNGTVLDGSDAWATENGKVAGWLAYKFTSPINIYKYSITSRNSVDTGAASKESAPKRWTFEGSSDGVNWVVLDARSNVIGWSINETRGFELEKNSISSFTHYRINISENNGWDNFTTVAELKLFEVTIVSTRGWNTISATLPLEDNFINDGMDDLSVFDRKNENYVHTMTSKGSLGSGKVFKGSIDLKKYFELTNVSLK